jgi:hypothetical protein
VKETTKKMLPDECPKLNNRSQSTRDNNRNEVVKLIMWLLLGHKNESDKETRDRQMSLINPILFGQIHVAITDDQEISQKNGQRLQELLLGNGWTRRIVLHPLILVVWSIRTTQHT